jgi:DnaJ-class molecular chaperone
MRIYGPCSQCKGEGKTLINHPQAHIQLSVTGNHSYETCGTCGGTGKGKIIAIVDELSQKKGPTS